MAFYCVCFQYALTLIAFYFVFCTANKKHGHHKHAHKDRKEHKENKKHNEGIFFSDIFIIFISWVEGIVGGI